MITRLVTRGVAAVTALSVAACAVGPGPMEQRAQQAGYACQMGDQYACADYQALYPAVMDERAQIAAQNNAVAGVAAAGLITAGAVAILAGTGGGGGRRSYRR